MNTVQIEIGMEFRPGAGSKHVATNDLAQLFIVSGAGNPLQRFRDERQKPLVSVAAEAAESA